MKRFILKNLLKTNNNKDTTTLKVEQTKSTLSTKNLSVLAEPILCLRSTTSSREAVPLPEPSWFTSRSRKSSHFAVFMYGFGDPLGVRVATDGFVSGIDENHFKELVGRILANPVAVQHAKTTTSTSDSALKLKH